MCAPGNSFSGKVLAGRHTRLGFGRVPFRNHSRRLHYEPSFTWGRKAEGREPGRGANPRDSKHGALLLPPQAQGHPRGVCTRASSSSPSSHLPSFQKGDPSHLRERLKPSQASSSIRPQRPFSLHRLPFISHCSSRFQASVTCYITQRPQGPPGNGLLHSGVSGRSRCSGQRGG